MEKPLLIASDVDGTLLDPLERMSPRTVDVLRRVHEAGVPVVLATGRPPRWIPSVAQAGGLTGYAVCANGAVLYDIGADEVVGVHGALDPMLLTDAVEELARVLPGCGFAAERVGRHAIDPDVQHLVIEHGYHNPWGDGEGVPVSRAEIVGRPAVKLLVSHPDMTSDEMARAAGAVLDGSFDITFSAGGGLIELAAHGITKATGLAEVAQRFEVPVERIIAFGDMPNDVDMLRWAGHGVAMANAHPDVLAVADEVTSPNSEDGVAQVLERWF
ncbi:HAD family hydrolase [Amycolatopsis thermophila]|uniref:Hydroxymethylpyrimidine pyrophosphatase-like HAD family hydrolase n=1 Tax=Amycolatopsis thermophila TaxID=206084 RepID=A0ABU0ERU2_9PSEU|nr:HAD family hydrolase [Amycolatopsis thermophila]MDQ0377998.1 hydroxymethylpyrimidine pyrophosphatase-like HAD family hydrolase [Amycolatopsis thermophila]